jgi:hypothetical protein
MSSPNCSVRLARSFIAVVSTGVERPPPEKSRLRQLPDWRPTHVISGDRRAELAFVDAEAFPESAPVPSGDGLTLILGDDAEWEETQGRSCMAGAACVEWDPAKGSLRIVSSIVGLPPIYLCRMPGAIAVASELHHFRALVELRADIDPQAVVELFTVGHPLEHRSLFKNITVMPGGHSFTANAQGQYDLTPYWNPPEPHPETDPSSYIDSQVEAFRQAVNKLHLSDSVLSLTGGLDTRAILAVLSGANVKLTACTITGGRTLCLDARQAAELCKAYGMPHVVVSLDEQFVRDLPTYVLEASRLSGGLASLGQAHEVYFYRQIQGLGSRRLSGILGNQVGRRGVEGISARNADLAVLADSVQRDGSVQRKEHWLSQISRRPGHTLLQSLIQCENLFSLLGNYSVGHHFMIQQHPYASRQLIDNALRATFSSGESDPFSPNRARLRDLHHRFLGEPLTQSFQRKVIAQAGGVIAKYPINWGWRAGGGPSVRGLAWGGLALADAASSRWHSQSSYMRKGLRLLGVDGIHEIRPWRDWFDHALREFVNDSLRSHLVTKSDLFSSETMVRLLDEHYQGIRTHYDTLLATLDLVLAQKVLTESP